MSEILRFLVETVRVLIPSSLAISARVLPAAHVNYPLPVRHIP